jgi:DeoR/GlpR family transcriptional regulator of sugar metabolism
MDRKDKILEIVKYFEEKFGTNKGPGTGYLAGLFKVSTEAIRLDLIDLEKAGKIKRVKTKSNFTSWVMVK